MDMMNVYKEVYSSCWSQREAWEKTIHHKAPRYYISPKRAYLTLSPMFFYGDFSALEKMKPARRRMYMSLYETVKKLANKPSYVGMSLRKIISYAISQEAPEFFVDWESMRKSFRWVKKGIEKDEGIEDSKGNGGE